MICFWRAAKMPKEDGHPVQGIEFEKHKQDVIKNNSIDNLIGVKKKYLTPIRLSSL